MKSRLYASLLISLSWLVTTTDVKSNELAAQRRRRSVALLQDTPDARNEEQNGNEMDMHELHSAKLHEDRPGLNCRAKIPDVDFVQSGACSLVGMNTLRMAITLNTYAFYQGPDPVERCPSEQCCIVFRRNGDSLDCSHNSSTFKALLVSAYNILFPYAFTRESQRDVDNDR
jgi:hypothetical protein